jgi:hypothetical protein
MMEDWNDEYRKERILKFFIQYSIIPPFHIQDLAGVL